jgi:hypothetical protein
MDVLMRLEQLQVAHVVRRDRVLKVSYHKLTVRMVRADTSGLTIFFTFVNSLKGRGFSDDESDPWAAGDVQDS